MKKTILTLLACVGGWLANTDAMLWADDFGTGVELEATKKFASKLKLGLTGEYRTQDGVNESERWAIGANASYKLYNKKKSKWEASANAGYLFISRYYPEHLSSSGKNVITAYWSPRHRAFASLTGTYKINKQWELSLRERYQYTYIAEQFVERYKVRNGVRNDDKIIGGTDKQMLRSRLQLKWNKKKCPWEAFVNTEAFSDTKDSFSLNQMRYTVGAEYKVNKHNAIGLSYRHKDKQDADEESTHLLKASYSFSF